MSGSPDSSLLGVIKVVVFALCLLPFGRLLWAAQTGDFGPDPVEFVQRWTGSWALNLLLITLAITPLRTMTSLPWLLRLRRMLGLFCFFYAALHFLSFIGFDHAFEIDSIARDVLKRPFVLVGFAAFVLLTPLAATSSNRAIRMLGGRRWQELHRNFYLISILVCVHYLWQSKATALLLPLTYSAAVALLLGWRIRERRRKAIPVPKFQSAKPLKFFKQKPD